MADDTTKPQGEKYPGNKDEKSNGKMKIVVDRALCIGAAPCVAVAPGVFQLDDEGKAYIVDAGGADEATIRLAAEACPVRAIFLYDDKTGEQLFPPVSL